MTDSTQIDADPLRDDLQVTIGMPIFENAATLQRAIDSVLKQSFAGWRLIISDDQSSDESARIADRAVAQDARISLLRQPKRLGYMNFRAPLDLAETPYFVWLAGDDFWHPDFLAQTLRALKAAPLALSALPQAAFLGPKERPIPNLGFLKGNASGRIRRYLAHPGGTRMYGLMRTAVLKGAFPPRSFHAYDWYLMVALLAQGPQLFVPQTLLYRDETPKRSYAEAFAADSPAGKRQSFPILEMSLQLVRDRRIPFRALPALVRLNLTKHEEFIALTDPNVWHRRRWLYRKMALPIASNPGRLAAFATRQTGIDKAQSKAAAAHLIRADGLATAILTFRNAASTLNHVLDHLEALGCKVIAIDHGSTDHSRTIAEARRGTVVDQVIDEAWTGTFDLTRQLTLKRQIIASMPTRWVVHADADEFLDLPEGQSLSDCLAQAEAGGRIAFACHERLFVPQFEDEEHDPQSFQKTMTAYVLMRERNVKQRLFRSDADLSLWMRTGGHTVTRDPQRIAEAALTLRHYPGLSLDHLRSQYHGRVFAPDDLARLWHSNRRAASVLDIVPPDPEVFNKAFAVEGNRLPFVATRPPALSQPLPTDADLYVIGENAGVDLDRLILSVLPRLRMARVDVAALTRMTRMVPVLHILSHPAGLHGPGIQRSIERSRAVDWTRTIAVARQWAVDRGATYAEVRAEDIAASPDALKARLVQLWHPPILRGTAGFIGPDAADVLQAPWENPVRSIAGSRAADLGYS